MGVQEFEGKPPVLGSLDITLYRDDLSTVAHQPVVGATDIPVDIMGKVVVLVDDVLFTGRTVRAALDELMMDFGRARTIQLAVLIDRGHRELPIRADYVGRTLATAREEAVQVLVREEDGRDEVVLVRADPPQKPAAKARPAAGRTKPRGAPRPASRRRR